LIYGGLVSIWEK